MTGDEGEATPAPRERPGGAASRPGSLARRDLITEIVRSVNHLFRTVDTFSRYALKEFGITGPQIWALRTVRSAGEITAGELSERMYLHLSTLSGILDRLEQRNYLTRRRKKEDRRVVTIRLTAAGRSVLRRAPEPPRSKILRGVQRLPDRELREMYRSTRRLFLIMEAAQIDRSRAGG
jgi:DNA-binding MarR family transcriptional regulator